MSFIKTFKSSLASWTRLMASVLPAMIWLVLSRIASRRRISQTITKTSRNAKPANPNWM